MKIASFTTLTLTALATLLAIWSPIGTWWQWAITAFVLLLIGAGLGGASASDTNTPPVSNPVSTEGTDKNGNPISADKTSGYNHVHVTNTGHTADQIVADFEKRKAKNKALHGQDWHDKTDDLSAKLEAMNAKAATLNNVRNDYGKKAQS